MWDYFVRILAPVEDLQLKFNLNNHVPEEVYVSFTY